MHYSDTVGVTEVVSLAPQKYSWTYIILCVKRTLESSYPSACNMELSIIIVKYVFVGGKTLDSMCLWVV